MVFFAAAGTICGWKPQYVFSPEKARFPLDFPRPVYNQYMLKVLTACLTEGTSGWNGDS